MPTASKVNMRDAIISNILHLDQWHEAIGGWFQTESSLLIRYAAAMMPETDFVLCKGNAFHQRKNFKVSFEDYYYDRSNHAILMGSEVRIALDAVKSARAFVTDNEWVMFNLMYRKDVTVNMIFEP